MTDERRTSDAANRQDFETTDLFDALDLPPALTPLQDAYWAARREWQAKDAAYRLVLKEMLEREEADPHV